MEWEGELWNKSRRRKTNLTFLTAASIFFFWSYPTVKVTRYFGLMVKSCKYHLHKKIVVLDNTSHNWVRRENEKSFVIGMSSNRRRAGQLKSLVRSALFLFKELRWNFEFLFLSFAETFFKGYSIVYSYSLLILLKHILIIQFLHSPYAILAFLFLIPSNNVSCFNCKPSLSLIFFISSCLFSSKT